MSQTIIDRTQRWIWEAVVGCNFCPFAARPLRQNKVRYEVLEGAETLSAVELLAKAFHDLEDDPEIETTLLIFPNAFNAFRTYLDMVEIAEAYLKEGGYEGVFQLATFHPKYRFEGAPKDDPANYTNRSPFPMLHVLREESLEAAIEAHPDAEEIPNTNIEFARNKGLEFMQAFLEKNHS